MRSGIIGALAGVVALVIVGFAEVPSAAQDTFEISGEIDGLYPGVDATLEARVTNPHPFGIEVNSVAVIVADASSRCKASMLTVDGSSESVNVPPGGTGTIPLAVEMDRDAPDGCQGATWPLEFVGVAVAVADEGAASQISLPGIVMTAAAALIALAAIWAAIRRRAS